MIFNAYVSLSDEYNFRFEYEPVTEAEQALIRQAQASNELFCNSKPLADLYHRVHRTASEMMWKRLSASCNSEEEEARFEALGDRIDCIVDFIR